MSAIQLGATESRRVPWLAVVLLAGLGLHAWRLDQPIFENAIGRQIPTAMVARNLDRGSGFLHPRLDTGPFPNEFLVEPPVYQALVVGLRRLTNLGLEPAGRLVSSLGILLAGLGLWGLLERRLGAATALASVAVFQVLPVVLRYGRAFQPDAMALGATLAGVAVIERATGPRRHWLMGAGWLLLAIGLSCKVLLASLLLPLGWLLVRQRRTGSLVIATTALLPVTAWYFRVALLLGAQSGSSASADNAAIWLGVLGGEGLLRIETYSEAARMLGLRAFGPLGFLAGAWGLVRLLAGRDNLRQRDSGFFRLWLAAVAGLHVIVAAKLHHEYYWLTLAPLMAVGAGITLSGWPAPLERSRRPLSFAGAGLLAMLGLWQAAATWTTPPEWQSLRESGRWLAARTPPDALVIAPEALLFAADRRGCRLEFEAASAVRAAGEWPGGAGLTPPDSLGLVEFYRRQGARYLADVTPGVPAARVRLHEALRQRYPDLVERTDPLFIPWPP